MADKIHNPQVSGVPVVDGGTDEFLLVAESDPGTSTPVSLRTIRKSDISGDFGFSVLITDTGETVTVAKDDVLSLTGGNGISLSSVGQNITIDTDADSSASFSATWSGNANGIFSEITLDSTQSLNVAVREWRIAYDGNPLPTNPTSTSSIYRITVPDDWSYVQVQLTTVSEDNSTDVETVVIYRPELHSNTIYCDADRGQDLFAANAFHEVGGTRLWSPRHPFSDPVTAESIARTGECIVLRKNTYNITGSLGGTVKDWVLGGSTIIGDGVNDVFVFEDSDTPVSVENGTIDGGARRGVLLGELDGRFRDLDIDGRYVPEGTRRESVRLSPRNETPSYTGDPKRTKFTGTRFRETVVQGSRECEFDQCEFDEGIYIDATAPGTDFPKRTRIDRSTIDGSAHHPTGGVDGGGAISVGGDNTSTGHIVDVENSTFPDASGSRPGSLIYVDDNAGTPEFRLSEDVFRPTRYFSESQLNVTGDLADNDTITIGSETWTFIVSSTDPWTISLVAGNTSTQMQNIINAINRDSNTVRAEFTQGGNSVRVIAKRDQAGTDDIPISVFTSVPGPPISWEMGATTLGSIVKNDDSTDFHSRASATAQSESSMELSLAQTITYNPLPLDGVTVSSPTFQVP